MVEMVVKKKVIGQLEALERHHKILGAVACSICGGPMTFMSSGQRGTKYSCEKALEECNKGEWMVTSPEWDHFCRSEIMVDHDRAKIHEDAARYIRNVLEGRKWSYHPEAEEFGIWLGMTGLFGASGMEAGG